MLKAGLSIRDKVTLITITAILAALISASILFLYHYESTYIESLRKESETIGSIVARRSAAAVAFRDRQAAEENLAALANKDTLLMACIYNADRKLFASHEGSGAIQCPPQTVLEAGSMISQHRLITQTAIERNGRTLGHLYTEDTLGQLQEQLRNFIYASVLITLLSSLIAFAIINLVLRRIVVMPILDLARTTRSVRKTRDFTIRARKMTNDEIGELSDDFNDMMSKVQEYQIETRELVDELRSSQQFYEAQALNLKERNQQIQQFFSGVSHDLKQPLQAIEIFAHALRDPDEAERQTLSERLSRSVENLQSLLAELLDVTRLEDRINDVVREDLSLAPILDNIQHEFEALAADKGLAISVEGVENARVHSNAMMLERVVRNLMSNAIRYTRKGEIRLSCQAEEQHVVLTVSDTGVGIPDQSLSRIFEPFTRVENGTGESGHGLGLSIVKRITSLLGIEVTIDSQVEGGTAFILKVPGERRRNGHTDTGRQKQPSAAADVQALSNKPTFKRVLLIDDDVDVLQSLETLIGSWGVEVQASDGTDERLNLDSMCPDIIISDYDLANGVTGDRVIERVRSHYQIAIPALIISGKHDSESLGPVLDDAGIRFMQKPVKPAKLRAILEFMFHNGSGA